MSWQSPAWGVLGIDSTSDQGAIRRAYAARLKAIDPDHDPDAFVALRDAYEQARREAQWLDQEAEADEGDAPEPDREAEGLGHEAPGLDREALETAILFDDDDPFDTMLATPAYPAAAEPPQPPAPQADRRGPWTPREPADYDAHARALLALFDRGDDVSPEPTPERAEAMQTHWRVLAADPRLEQMGHFADVERWIAGLLAYNSPFSDPLVRPVSDFFGWVASAEEVGQPWDIAFLARRRRALAFADAVSAPGHPLHAAWVELTTPAGERSRRGRVSRRDVEALLKTVRRDAAEVEGNFDGYRVGLWEKKQLPAWVGTIGWWFLILIVIQAFHLTKCASSTAPPIPVVVGPAGLADARTDIDRALLLAYEGKLNLALIDAKNPDLAAALRRQWQSARDDNMAWASFAIALRTLLDQRYRSGLDRGPLPVLQAHQRYQVAEIRWMQSLDPQTCARALQGSKFETRMPMPPLLEEQRKALVVQVLLETRPGAPARPGAREFAVPHDVVEKAAARAAMPPQELMRAMRFEGPAAAQCKARIAFIETVLALPDKRAEPLLRAM